MPNGDIPDVTRDPPPHMRPPEVPGARCRCRNCGHLAEARFNVPCHHRSCPRCGAPMEEA